MSDEDPNPSETGEDFDPYRYGRPDPNPTHDAFGRRLPSGQPPAPGPAQQPGAQAPGPWPSPPPNPYPGPYQMPPGTPPGWVPVQQGSNGMATAGMVLGIVSLVLFWTSVIDIPIVILGITFSAIGLKRAKLGAGARGMAMAGLICSLIAAVVVAVLLAVIVPRYVHCHDKWGDNSTQIRKCITGDD